MNWLARDLIVGPELCLCTSQEEFERVLTEVGVPISVGGPWLSTPQSDATVHHLEKDRRLICVVCVRPDPERRPLTVCGLLVHEAVHVFDRLCDWIGEDKPSSEFRAYSTQAIAQELMTAYRDQVVCKEAAPS